MVPYASAVPVSVVFLLHNQVMGVPDCVQQLPHLNEQPCIACSNAVWGRHCELSTVKCRTGLIVSSRLRW